jgi:hypothetical protein
VRVCVFVDPIVTVLFVSFGFLLEGGAMFVSFVRFFGFRNDFSGFGGHSRVCGLNFCGGNPRRESLWR